MLCRSHKEIIPAGREIESLRCNLSHSCECFKDVPDKSCSQLQTDRPRDQHFFGLFMNGLFIISTDQIMYRMQTSPVIKYYRRGLGICNSDLMECAL